MCSVGFVEGAWSRSDVDVEPGDADHRAAVIDDFLPSDDDLARASVRVDDASQIYANWPLNVRIDAYLRHQARHILADKRSALRRTARIGNGQHRWGMTLSGTLPATRRQPWSLRRERRAWTGLASLGLLVVSRFRPI
jgi:hypothetical protein